MFKSKANSIFDYKKANVSDVFLQLDIQEKEIEGSLLNIAKKHSTLEDVQDVVKDGDIVEVKIEDDQEKYNKNSVMISVGLGLFNKDFEDNLIGMKLGETKVINIDENTVEAKILNAKRKVVPVITNEMIVEESIKDVNSIEDYRNYFIENKVSDYKKEYIEEKVEGILDEIIEKSEYLISDEDLESIWKEIEEEWKEYEEEGGEKITEEEILSKMGFKTLEEFNEYNIRSIKIMFIGVEIAKEEGLECAQETYEDFVKEIAEGEEITIEEAKKEYSLNYHLLNYDAKNAYLKTLEYFIDRVHVKVNII